VRRVRPDLTEPSGAPCALATRLVGSTCPGTGSGECANECASPSLSNAERRQGAKAGTFDHDCWQRSNSDGSLVFTYCRGAGLVKMYDRELNYEITIVSKNF
jgi:hypothetical protein